MIKWTWRTNKDGLIIRGLRIFGVTVYERALLPWEQKRLDEWGWHIPPKMTLADAVRETGKEPNPILDDLKWKPVGPDPNPMSNLALFVIDHRDDGAFEDWPELQRLIEEATKRTCERCGEDISRGVLHLCMAGLKPKADGPLDPGESTNG